MWFIPDSLWESLAVGRVVASARSTDAGRRRRPARWTRLSASNRLRSRSSPPDEDHGRSSLCSRRRPARRQRPSRRPPPTPAARPRPSAPGYSLALQGPPTGKNEAGRRATPARPRAPNPSRQNGQRPRCRPPRPGAASSPRRARPQSAFVPAVPMVAFSFLLSGAIRARRPFAGQDGIPFCRLTGRA